MAATASRCVDAMRATCWSWKRVSDWWGSLIKWFWTWWMWLLVPDRPLHRYRIEENAQLMSGVWGQTGWRPQEVKWVRRTAFVLSASLWNTVDEFSPLPWSTCNVSPASPCIWLWRLLQLAPPPGSHCYTSLRHGDLAETWREGDLLWQHYSAVNKNK